MTSEPMSDDDARYFEAFMLGAGPFLGSHFGDGPPAGERGAFWWHKHFRAYAARIEALTAERDAAMAALNMKPHERNSHALGIMEGERRGSAKAVVFMKREYAMDGWDVVNAIERGDHLKNFIDP